MTEITYPIAVDRRRFYACCLSEIGPECSHHDRLTESERFFYVNAGYSYDPATETRETGRVRSALSLARAERIAEQRGWQTIVSPDDDDCADPDDDGETARALRSGDLVRLMVDVVDASGEPLGSLGSVIVNGDDDPYLRVVAAEIASEHMTETHDLGRPSGTDDDGERVTASDWQSTRGRVFGHLMRLAAPGLTHYRSDLFHDALWLDRYLTEPMTFYFSCEDTGTNIGTDASVACYRRNAYRVDLSLDESRGRWRERFTLTITAVPSTGR